ncbi:hypothetical protein [Bacillus smithii]|uniref:hypothetical protein n=1 Tax=Bacillus smithii TaxID=1479 RepID=UPI003D1B813D
MKNVIEILRKLDGVEDVNYNKDYEEIENIIEAYKPEGYSIENVHNEFQDGGRWTNIESNVLWREVPATELQDGMDLSWGFYEVIPKEVTVIKYVLKNN